MKPANKQYSNLNNDYELTFSEASELIPCNDKVIYTLNALRKMPKWLLILIFFLSNNRWLYITQSNLVILQDTASIPRTQFNFAQLGQITAEHKDETVDVIGICRSASDVTNLTSSKTGKELTKRDLNIVDQRYWVDYSDITNRIF